MKFLHPLRVGTGGGGLDINEISSSFKGGYGRGRTGRLSNLTGLERLNIMNSIIGENQIESREIFRYSMSGLGESLFTWRRLT
jgi:hypothetical protein